MRHWQHKVRMVMMFSSGITFCRFVNCIIISYIHSIAICQDDYIFSSLLCCLWLNDCTQDGCVGSQTTTIGNTQWKWLVSFRGWNDSFKMNRCSFRNKFHIDLRILNNQRRSRILQFQLSAHIMGDLLSIVCVE